MSSADSVALPPAQPTVMAASPGPDAPG
ncbi:MAG: hypothetical protein QOG52_1297, partial [Frankiaceae bacterium]|nr:hypothetical protein [Frankiaceae bacterium]